jgi:hypothetical protein
MEYVNILIYSGKHGNQYWLVDTEARLHAAFRALFTMLDADGCYDEDDRDIGDMLEAARSDDIKSIKTILEIRDNYEYEGWRIEQADVLA